MTHIRTTPHLAHVDDKELERLAVLWRTQALRGNREAYGIAHVLETEQRRRLRPSQMVPLQPEYVILKRPPWWKFWIKGPR